MKYWEKSTAGHLRRLVKRTEGNSRQVSGDNWIDDIYKDLCKELKKVGDKKVKNGGAATKNLVD